MEPYVMDIETNGFLREVTEVHCVALRNINKYKETHLFTNIEAALRFVDENASLLVGHHICGYDLPVLKKLHNWEPQCHVFDTMLAGNILWPEETLSLETWAKKLGLEEQKIQNEDWSVYTKNMGDRCFSDTGINLRVYEYMLRQELLHQSLSALVIEQKVATIHAAQAITGVHFDLEKAALLLLQIDEERREIRDRILKTAPWKCRIEGVAASKQEEEKIDRAILIEMKGSLTLPGSPAFKKDGTYNVATEKYFGPNYKQVRGNYTKVSFDPLNLNSGDQVKELLLSLGWIPTEWNQIKDADGSWRMGSPKLTEDSYDSLPPGLGQDIARYNVLKHRRNWLLSENDAGKGAIATAYAGGGIVGAEAFTCGTPTARYRHSGVICNLPRVSTPYGKEIRGLLGVALGHFLLGVDLSGIEARMLAAYLLKGNYKNARETADLILSPDKHNDFHTFNAKAWGVDRNTAKSILYALMYGAGAKKLASIAGRRESQGKKLKDDFYKAHPGIKQLIDDLGKAIRNRGHLIALDGRPLYIREERKALNSLLQNGAAIVFKKWMIRCAELAPQYNAKQIIAYHDELQFSVASRTEATSFGQAVCKLATEVGQEMGLLVPIAAEYKVGLTYADTH